MDDGNQHTPDSVGELAPVIPLFGRGVPRGERRIAASDPESGGAVDGAAAVRPLRSARRRGDDRDVNGGEGQWHVTWTDDVPDEGVTDEAEAEARERAEKALLKKLRSRSLSEREARGVLTEHGLDAHTVEAVVESFLRHGYLDDLRLAEHLAYVGADRKKQGRQAIAQTLSSRGIPREVVDAVLAETEDDDAVRALEFARHKARSLRSLDHEVALRRLVGQLARRGYAGPIAMNAARAALQETDRGPVRFE